MPAMFRWMATIQPGYREAWAASGRCSSGERRLVVGRVGEPRLPRAVPRPVDVDGPARAAAPRASRSGRRKRASAAWRPTSRDWPWPTAAWTRLDLAEVSRPRRRGLDRPKRWALSLADVAADSDRHAAAVAGASARALSALAERPPGCSSRCCGSSTSCWPARARPLAPEARPPVEPCAIGRPGRRLARSILARTP